MPVSLPRTARRGAVRTAVACGLIAAVVALGCQPAEKKSAEPERAVPVEVASVQQGRLDRTLSAVGTLSSPQETVVAPQVDGKIVTLNVDQGSAVTEGTVIARLDDALQRAAVKAAEAALANAQQIYRRDRSVADTGAVSDQQLQSDRAAVQEAEARLEQARANLAYTAVHAPFTGLVGLRNASLGAYVRAGDPLVRIYQFDPLYLDFDLPQHVVERLRVGQRVEFTASGVRGDLTGRVTAIDPALAAGSRTVRVRATVANRKRRLKPGMFATVALVTGTVPDALFIPMQALVAEGQDHAVWVVGPDDRVKRRPVRVGVYRENRVQIVEGLSPGDRVVTAGTQKLRPGARVETEPYQPIQNPRLKGNGSGGG